MTEDAIERESMEYDVVIVGAGPAGLFRGDPPETGGCGGRVGDIRRGAREGLRGRRAYPVRRGD